MTTQPQRQRGAPGWRELRQHRIEQFKAERDQRRNDRLRPRPKPRDEAEDDDQQQERPQKAAQQPVARAGKPSAITSRDTLRKQRGGIERVAAWVVLLVSFAGSMAVFHGGFAPMIESLRAGRYNVGALSGGAIVQIVLTFLEWYYFDRPFIAWGARLFDTATTALGFGPLFLAPLVVFIAARGVHNPLLPAWGIIILVSLAIAWFPESRLVD